jgi:putative autoinducer-2 (AI-2) aldolase
MIEVFTDGRAEPNPGLGTYGYVVYEDGRRTHSEHGLAGHGVSNNYAEYLCLVKALERLEVSRDEEITVFSDSTLLVNQMAGRWKFKGGAYANKYLEAKELARRFSKLRFEWIPREKNAEADDQHSLRAAERQVRSERQRIISAAGGRQEDISMDYGLKNRISRMVRPSTGHSVMLACDHGYFMGPTRRLENPRNTISPLVPYADVVSVTRGILRSSVDPEWDIPILLRVSGGTSILQDDLSNEGITTSMKDAVRLNATAVSISIFVGAPNEKRTLLNLGKLVDEGEEYGVPVMAITAVGKELEKRDNRYLSLACRIAAELGAHMVKTYYCEGFSRVVEGCPVPLVVAGGPKLNTEADVFHLVHNAIEEGAVGVDMGRNIWQNDNPVAVIKAINAIVHEGASEKEALDLFNQGKDGGACESRPVAKEAEGALTSAP